MSLKKKLFGVPATIIGVALGLLLGAFVIVKELLDKKFPWVGLTIAVVTPLLTFVFDKVMSLAFPEWYWERLAGKLIKLYRFIINEEFRLRFFYELRFPIRSDVPNTYTAENICVAVHATAGGDPEPTTLGTNYVYLRFSRSPFLIAMRWYIEELDEDDIGDNVTVFRLTMEPEVRGIVMRRMSVDVEAVISRLNNLQRDLSVFVGSQPQAQLVADAWFGDTIPTPQSIVPSRRDPVSGSSFRTFPGLLHLSGNGASTLLAISRLVPTLVPQQDTDPAEA